MEGGEIIVVSDACGFVGAFHDIVEAKLKVFDKFKLVPFLVQRFPLVCTAPSAEPPSAEQPSAEPTSAEPTSAEPPAAEQPSESSSDPPTVNLTAMSAVSSSEITVWVVPYRDTNAVAYVSNSRSHAIRVQQSLQNVGLTYPDSIDYWQQPLGMVVLAAGERLASITRAHQMYASEAMREEEKRKDEAAEELIKRVVDGVDESPLDRLIRENERITIFDCVVDIIDNVELQSDGDAELQSDGDDKLQSDDEDAKSPANCTEDKQVGEQFD